MTIADELTGNNYGYTYDSMHRLLSETKNSQTTVSYVYNSIAEMYGGNFGDGFAGGAKTAAIGASANCFAPLLVIGGVVAVKAVGGLIAHWGLGIAATFADKGNIVDGQAGQGVNAAMGRAKPIVYGSGAAGLAASGVVAGGVYTYGAAMMNPGLTVNMMDFANDFINPGPPSASSWPGATYLGSGSRWVYDKIME